MTEFIVSSQAEADLVEAFDFYDESANFVSVRRILHFAQDAASDLK